MQFSDRYFDRLLMQNDGLSLIEPRTVLDTSTMAGLSDTLPVVKRKKETEEKCKRKKERTNETFCSYPTTKRRRLGNVAASCVIGTTFTHYHNPNTLLHRAIVSILRFFETRPSLVSRLENPIIQTQRASSSKLVETDPVFVADGHEVCRVVLLRELCLPRDGSV